MNLSWQAVATIASFLAAFAAWGTAWLIYRSRPLAVRAIELHSKQFQEKLLPDWKSSVPGCPNISSYYVDTWAFSSGVLSQIENSQLFQDLPNHIPSSSSLMPLWQNYRKDWEGLEKSRRAFVRKIRDFVDQAAKDIGLLGVGLEKDRNCIFERHFVERYYNAILELCQKRAGPYEGLKRDVSRLELAGNNPPYCVEYPVTCWALIDDKVIATKAIELFGKLVNELPTVKPPGEPMSLVEEARKLCDNNNRLAKLSGQIRHEIDCLIALPLLPNPDCPLLRLATPQLIPGAIRKLAIWVSSHRRKAKSSR